MYFSVYVIAEKKTQNVLALEHFTIKPDTIIVLQSINNQSDFVLRHSTTVLMAQVASPRHK